MARAKSRLLIRGAGGSQAQFTLGIRPVAPGTGELCFTLEPGYYYCLESSGDFTGTFSPASSWMLGDGVESVIGIRDEIAPSEDA